MFKLWNLIERSCTSQSAVDQRRHLDRSVMSQYQSLTSRQAPNVSVPFHLTRSLFHSHALYTLAVLATMVARVLVPHLRTSRIESESFRCPPLSFEHALAQANTSSGICLSEACLFRSSILMRLDQDPVPAVGRRLCLTQSPSQPLAIHRLGEAT